jgi:hypothetical protein
MRTARAERWLLALLLAGAMMPAASAELGTLFHSPEERERLDRLRRGEPDRPVAAARSGGGREVTGFVKRSDGRGTVWIDGVPMQLATPRAQQLLEPGTVQGYSERETLRIERRPPK